MRKFTVIFATFIFLVLFGANIVQADAADNWLDETKLSNGVVSVVYNSDIKIKFRVDKDNKTYTYDLQSGKKESFPLQLGSGKYTFSIIHRDENQDIQFIKLKTIDVNIESDAAVYLSSVQNISWDKNNIVALKAASLTKSEKDDVHKAKAIYKYIVDNVKYDYDLYENVEKGYLPDVERTIMTKKGICYDFASLYASMLRSVGIPSKLIMGFSDYVNSYHAWNEVYLNGEWIIVDISVDANLKELNKKYDFRKSASKYKVQRTF